MNISKTMSGAKENHGETPLQKMPLPNDARVFLKYIDKWRFYGKLSENLKKLH